MNISPYSSHVILFISFYFVLLVFILLFCYFRTWVADLLSKFFTHCAQISTCPNKYHRMSWKPTKVSSDAYII